MCRLLLLCAGGGRQRAVQSRTQLARRPPLSPLQGRRAGSYTHVALSQLRRCSGLAESFGALYKVLVSLLRALGVALEVLIPAPGSATGRQLMSGK